MNVLSHPSGLMSLRILVVLAAIAPLALAVPGLLDDDRAVATTANVATTAPASPASQPEPATVEGNRPILGCAMVCHHISDMELYHDSIDSIVELGANSLVIVTPMFQERVHSSRIRFLPKRCPTDEQLTALLTHAKRRGLFTALQPIVLIEHPGDKDWRGVIEPRSWTLWWESYQQMIDRFVAIAVSADVDLFAVGSELNTTESQVVQWKKVIGTVRAQFDGQLSYSANWDRYRKVMFWNNVDIMSVSSYFELQRDDYNAPEARLVEDWVVQRDLLLEIASARSMPLLLSEVGYPSLPWAAAHPWNYVAPNGTVADHESQARAYRAFLTAWTDVVLDPQTPAAGFFCYHWDPYHHGQPKDTGYGIRGKPSYEVIQKGFEAIRARSQSK